MKKQTMYILGGLAVVLMLGRARAPRPVEIVQAQTSDWQGDLWARLSGADLVVPGARNVASAGHPNAAPSYVDLANYWQMA